jgi:bifunctional DNA-binding transcriptional regulator/antitoxin component of YhaV-PrlF toxin-antitoxin module
MGRLDASGRVADRSVTRALNWLPGDRLTLTATPGVVIARRDPAGMVTVTTRPYVVIPAVLRRRCGMHTGDRVLLAATLREDVLAVYPLSVVDHAIRAQHHLLEVGGGQR